MDITDQEKIVRINFDFGWKTGINSIIAEFALKYNHGDILDVGCGTCSLLKYLQKKGWKGKYYGIDNKKYQGYEYPEDINLIIGDALEIDFPKVNTMILYNVLEHMDERADIFLISKALTTSENVLINVPKRNEEMWKYGIVEYHQLDKTHKHCGFTKEELYKLVHLADGEIINYEEHDKIDATIGINLWKNKFLKKLLFQFKKIFKSQVFFYEIWAEVKPKTEKK